MVIYSKNFYAKYLKINKTSVITPPPSKYLIPTITNQGIRGKELKFLEYRDSSLWTPAHLHTEYRTAASAGGAPGAECHSQPAAGTAGTSDLKETRQGKEAGLTQQKRNAFKAHLILSPFTHINTLRTKTQECVCSPLSMKRRMNNLTSVATLLWNNCREL